MKTEPARPEEAPGPPCAPGPADGGRGRAAGDTCRGGGRAEAPREGVAARPSGPAPEPGPPPAEPAEPGRGWSRAAGPDGCAPLGEEELGGGHRAGAGVALLPRFMDPSSGELALEQPSGCGPTPAAPGEPAGCEEEAPRLRAVFDALDSDGDGFVRIEDFVQFATVYGAEQVKDLTKYLDPSGLGVISFEDFYRGITAIRSGDSESQLCGDMPAQEEEPLPCPDEFDDFVTFEAAEVSDSAYMGSEGTYSECETFTDEDTSTLVHAELQHEGDVDSAGGSAVPSECLDAAEESEPDPGALLLLAGRPHLHGQPIVTVIRGEEHFEDYGEGSEGEPSPETPPLCNGGDGYGGPAFLSPSPTKRLSSKKVARHLHQSGALSMEALADPPRDPTEGAEEDIAGKVVFLERRVSELEKDTAASGEQHSRLRQENLQLVHRANALEEQLKEQELRASSRALEEARRQKELLCRLERERSIEVENLQARLQQLDEENGELRSCTPCLKASIERLEEEKQRLLDEIEDLSLRLSQEQESRRQAGDRLSHERHRFQRDREATQELIEDLRKQLEQLQLFKLEAEQRRGRSSSAGLQEYNSRTRESELEQEVRRLKQDNRSLKEQNDELNGQIINLSIQGAKNLFSTSFSESLAAEISSVSRDEVTPWPRALVCTGLARHSCPALPTADGSHPKAGRDQLAPAGLHRQDRRGHHGDQPFHPGGEVGQPGPGPHSRDQQAQQDAPAPGRVEEERATGSSRPRARGGWAGQFLGWGLLHASPAIQPCQEERMGSRPLPAEVLPSSTCCSRVGFEALDPRAGRGGEGLEDAGKGRTGRHAGARPGRPGASVRVWQALACLGHRTGAASSPWSYRSPPNSQERCGTRNSQATLLQGPGASRPHDSPGADLFAAVTRRGSACGRGLGQEPASDSWLWIHDLRFWRVDPPRVAGETGAAASGLVLPWPREPTPTRADPPGCPVKSPAPVVLVQGAPSGRAKGRALQRAARGGSKAFPAWASALMPAGRCGRRC
nr:rab11 family-interacting protein 3 isoform X3 [Dasypus novemcinctus]